MAGTSISRSSEKYLDHQREACPDQASLLPYIIATLPYVIHKSQWYLSTAELRSAYQQQM